MKESAKQIGSLEVHGRELDSLSEAIVVMEAVKNRGSTYLGETSLAISNGQDAWSGTRTIDEAIAIACYGWPEGRALMREVLEQIDTEEMVGRRQIMQPYQDVAGDEVDIDRYLAGEHENMTQYALKYDQKGKVVSLFVNCSVSASVRPQQIIKRGAAILAAKEVLSSSGYSMGITMVESTHNYNTKVEYYIPLIAPGEFLDLDTAAFCLAHPAFLRRLIFAQNDNEPNDLRQTMGFIEGQGYGTPSRISLPLPEAALVIETHEGLELNTQADIVNYTKSVIQRAADQLSSEH